MQNSGRPVFSGVTWYATLNPAMLNLDATSPALQFPKSLALVSQSLCALLVYDFGGRGGGGGRYYNPDNRTIHIRGNIRKCMT